MTICSSIACSETATHFSRRFGPRSPYCFRDACWSDGVDPVKVTGYNRPQALPTTGVDVPDPTE
jgi:hypothetical protein